MANGISGGAALPTRTDYVAIERRVRHEQVDELRASLPRLEHEAADATAREEPLRAAFSKEARHARMVDGWKTAGVVIGSSAAIGATIGGIAGAAQSSASTRLGGAVLGAIFGAIAMPMFIGFAGTIGGGFSDVVRYSGPQESEELLAAGTRAQEANAAVRDATRDVQRYAIIAPGTAWLKTPTDQGDAKVGDWVDTVFQAHDHDHDGALRIDDTSQSPRNELIRNPQGGPVASDREADVSISSPYRLSTARLESYDLDSNGTVSRAELAEGMVRDAPRGWGELYWNTDDRRD